MAGKGKQRTPLLKRRNWFVSAGLLIALYLIMLLILRQFPDSSPLMTMCHALPLIAILMVALGFLEKRKQEQEHRERARKRYEARMEISRAQRQVDALTRQKDAAAKKNGGSTNESR